MRTINGSNNKIAMQKMPPNEMANEVILDLAQNGDWEFSLR